MLASITLVLALGGCGPRHVCFCLEDSNVPRYVATASLVITGTVLTRTDTVFANEGVKAERATFAITEVLKGPRSEKVDIFSGGALGDCTVRFEVGRAYLVYAFPNPGDGPPVLVAWRCDGTKPIDAAAIDLSALRAATPATPH